MKYVPIKDMGVGDRFVDQVLNVFEVVEVGSADVLVVHIAEGGVRGSRQVLERDDRKLLVTGFESVVDDRFERIGREAREELNAETNG